MKYHYTTHEGGRWQTVIYTKDEQRPTRASLEANRVNRDSLEEPTCQCPNHQRGGYLTEMNIPNDCKFVHSVKFPNGRIWDATLGRWRT